MTKNMQWAKWLGFQLSNIASLSFFFFKNISYARTMQSYKARLLYIITIIREFITKLPNSKQLNI